MIRSINCPLHNIDLTLSSVSIDKYSVESVRLPGGHIGSNGEFYSNKINTTTLTEEQTVTFSGPCGCQFITKV